MNMASSSYRKFLKLISEWSVDSGKPGLHLGQYLRNRVSEVFKHGDASIVNERECEVTYKHLSSIANDEFRLQYKRRGTSSATGLPAGLCKQALTTEALSMIKYSQQGFFSRLRIKLFGK
ncbi:Mitochondrial nucleoid factor 1 [Chamberlinius hualienensis]